MPLDEGNNAMPPFKDLSGQRFDCLLVLRRDPDRPAKTNGVYFLCLCDCGNTTSRASTVLTRQTKKICYCLKEKPRKHELGWNHPDVRNPRRRELYAQKRDVGHVRVRDEAYRERKRERHQERMQEEPEAVRALWRSGSHRRRANIMGAAINDFTDAQWEEMKAAYGYRCVYCPTHCKACKNKTHKLTPDHITPLSKGGDNTASNIVPACLPCNKKKNRYAVLKPVQPVLLLLSPPKSL
jgi:HNH endonuclease